MIPRSLRSRIRKTIKWGGAAVTVLLVVVWIGSAWCGFAWLSGTGTALAVQGGCVVVQHLAGISESFVVPPRRSYFFNNPVEFGWWVDWEHSEPNWFLAVPIWPFVVLAVLCAAIAWTADARAARRARLNLCPKCNYDRAGIAADAKCPECGAGGSAAP